MDASEKVFSLKGMVQNYSWGGYDFIPNLLGLPNPNHQPFAEYWLGAHPNHSSLIGEKKLSELIEKQPIRFLGQATATQFSGLPYLFKVLDVRQMLSIQVHPSIASAEKGFEEENKKGIPLQAPHRNYKDRNHKPEMMVALGDFWLLHGFKKENELRQTLESTPEFGFLKKVFQGGGYKALYEEVMYLQQNKLNEVLHSLEKRILPAYQNGSLSKNSADFWAARAMETFCRKGEYDRGIFSIYFFNLVHLKKGEGVFQPSGMPHAYLEGQNVELMANSDNVLRAGLTDKHIDVPELMKHIHFTATEPRILRPEEKKEEVIFSSLAPEFELHQYNLSEGQKKTIQIGTPSILLLIEGQMELWAGTKQMQVKKGEAVFILPDSSVEMNATRSLVLFRALVPAGTKNSEG